MKIALICAMEEELAEILENVPLKLSSEVSIAKNCYTRYSYNHHEIIAVICGIGKVNAAITTQALIDNFELDAVINVGVAGSLTLELGFGDVVIAEDLVQHDFDITAFGVPLGQIARMDTFSFAADRELIQLLATISLPDNKLVTGRIVSGDQFIDDKVKAQQLYREFNALACEMEGAAVAHVCYVNNVPFAVIRSLSDMAGQDGEAIHTFNDLKYMASQRAALVVRNLLERIN